MGADPIFGGGGQMTGGTEKSGGGQTNDHLYKHIKRIIRDSYVISN